MRYDWATVQKYYDEGHSSPECRLKFGTSHRAMNRNLKTRGYKESSSLARKSGRYPLKPKEAYLTPATKRFYSSVAWKKLRIEVFERDNYTCKDCSIQGGYLEANHIKPRSKYPDLKLEASNVETLCKKCHDKKKWLVYALGL